MGNGNSIVASVDATYYPIPLLSRDGGSVLVYNLVNED
jgi:hypothetical protein